MLSSSYQQAHDKEGFSTWKPCMDTPVEGKISI